LPPSYLDFLEHHHWSCLWETYQIDVSFILMTFPSHSMAHNHNTLRLDHLINLCVTMSTFAHLDFQRLITKCNLSPGMCWSLREKIKFFHLNKSWHPRHPHPWKGLTRGLSNAIIPLFKGWIKGLPRVQQITLRYIILDRK